MVGDSVRCDPVPTAVMHPQRQGIGGLYVYASYSEMPPVFSPCRCPIGVAWFGPVLLWVGAASHIVQDGVAGHPVVALVLREKACEPSAGVDVVAGGAAGQSREVAGVVHCGAVGRVLVQLQETFRS